MSSKEYYRKYRATVKGKEVTKRASLRYRTSEYGRRKRNINTKRYRSTIHGHMQKLWAQTRSRAQNRNLEFNITVDFLKRLWNTQDGRCAVTFKLLHYGLGTGRHKDGISIDRVDSSRGYTKDNVRFICDAVNMMKNNMPDEELREWCRDILMSESTGKYVPNFNTFADVVDRLAVTTHKLAHYENLKREESLKTTPNENLIVDLDRKSRNECEYRNLLKRELDKIISDIVRKGKYETLPDYRTFLAPPKTVSELISDLKPSKWKKELAEALEFELKINGIK